MPKGSKRNDPCPCDSGKKYKHCCWDRERAEGGRGASFGRLYQYIDPDEQAPDELMLLLETPAGVLQRRVPSASPLRLDMRHGEAAEEATRDAAALWGLPDFTYRASIRKVGSGRREVGDGALIVRDQGVMVQVKSRQAPSADPAKERRWVEKQIARGLSQAAGSIRSLCMEPASLTNARGRTVEVDGKKLHWLIVLVVDHPVPPKEVIPPAASGSVPTVVLLRRDWEFLFDQLESTHAVVEYLQRVSGDPIELGLEPVRYHELASADAQAPPDPPHPSVAGGGELISTPLLPLEPVASEDVEAHLMVRGIFEDIATTILRNSAEEDRLRALGELDRLQVGQRAIVGRYLLEALGDVADVPEPEVKWQLRRIVGGPGRAHLAFGTCSRFSEELQHAFSTWVQLRHHEHREATGESELTTVGVLLTPRRDGRRPWDTSMCAVAGDLGLTDEDLDAYRDVWGGPRTTSRTLG